MTLSLSPDSSEPTAPRLPEFHWQWHTSVDPRMVGTGEAGTEESWPSWRAHLASRERVWPWPAKGEHPLSWCLPKSEAQTLPTSLAPSPKSPLDPAYETCWQQLLEELHRPLGDVKFDRDAVLDILGLAYTWPAAAAHLPYTSWTGMLAALYNTARAAHHSPELFDPIWRLFLGGELAIALARAFPEIVDFRALAAAGRRFIQQSIETDFDNGGFPAARFLPHLRLWLASLYRARALHQPDLDPQPWDAAVESQLATAMRLALAMTTRGDEHALSVAPQGWSPALLNLAMDAHPSLAEVRFALSDLGIKGFKTPKVKAEGKAKSSKAKPGKTKGDKSKAPAAKSRGPKPFDPAQQSDWAEAAILRSEWDADASLLALVYDEPQIQLQFDVFHRTWFRGAARIAITFDGEPVEPAGDWENVCWEADHDIVYCELEQRLERGFRLQRQCLLSRHENFLLLADAVLGTERGALGYRAELPLAPEITIDPAERSRELWLRQGKRAIAALPLFLPEWKSQRFPGFLEANAERLAWGLERPGIALFAPLWLDFDRRRAGEELTWRQLTVAEQQRICPHDLAVGYRIQIARAQWAVYRSLGQPANRTFLGKNLLTEFLAARFTKTGTMETLLEIE